MTPLYGFAALFGAAGSVLLMATLWTHAWLRQWPTQTDTTGLYSSRSNAAACNGDPASDFFAYYGLLAYDSLFCNAADAQYATRRPSDPSWACVLARNDPGCKSRTNSITVLVSNLQQQYLKYSGSGKDSFLTDFKTLQDAMLVSVSMIIVSLVLTFVAAFISFLGWRSMIPSALSFVPATVFVLAILALMVPMALVPMSAPINGYTLRKEGVDYTFDFKLDFEVGYTWGIAFLALVFLGIAVLLSSLGGRMTVEDDDDDAADDVVMLTSVQPSHSVSSHKIHAW